MFPIVLNTNFVHIGLVGSGPMAVRRARMLMASKPQRMTVYSADPSPELRKVSGRALIERLPQELDFEQLRVLFICDVEREDADKLIEMAWSKSVLVTYEDNPAKCDFHVPGIVRRGDLLLSVSTAGKTPAVTAQIRKRLSELFGPDWKGHIEDVAKARSVWRENGAPNKEIARMTAALVKEKNWLP